MPVIIDDLGAWFEVGIIQPDHTWQLTTNAASAGSLFRLTYATNWAEWENTTKFKSYGLLRFHYQKAGAFETVDRARRIYPKNETELLEFPPPPQFGGTNIIRVAGVKRVTYDRRGHDGMNINNIINWSIKIEYLLV